MNTSFKIIIRCSGSSSQAPVMLLRILKRILGIPPPEPAYWWAIADCWEVINIHGTRIEFEDSFALFPDFSKNVFAAHWAISEIMNGALPQLFFNSAGVLAPEAVGALFEIGLESSAKALEQAISEVGVPFPLEREDRLEVIEPLYGTYQSPVQEQLLDRLLELTDEFLDGLGKGCKNVEPSLSKYANRFRSGA